MHRVVVTGMGVVAPNGIGLREFGASLREGRSGIRRIPRLEELGFSCQVAGVPEMGDLPRSRFDEGSLRSMNSNMIHAALAGLECWEDAGLSLPKEGDPPDWESGAIIGTGIGGVDTLAETVVPKVNAGQVRRLGSSIVEQVMSSSVSAKLGGILGLGGQVTSNSSACSTGTEAVIDAFFKIREGRASRVLAGGSEGASPYIWSGFDAMRVLSRGYNDRPTEASRPMSAAAAGFVPAAGAGVLLLESLESARARGARIHAEVVGGHVNCGGQRDGGSMTAPNPRGVQKCIREAVRCAEILPDEIDAINGHLTATMADPIELENWRSALELDPARFPRVSATKSLIGHALGAAGGIECVASVIQLTEGFVHGSLNCGDLHPEIERFAASISRRSVECAPNILAKASFGFGDVNACVIFRKWS